MWLSWSNPICCWRHLVISGAGSQAEGGRAEENVVGSRRAEEAIREANSPKDLKFNLPLSFWKRALSALNWDMTCSGKAEHDFT